MQITTRPAKDSDREFASSVHHRGYRDVVTRQYGSWSEAAQDEFFAANWSAVVHEIILCQDVPCGYLCVENRDSEIHLSEVVIEPEFQGRGIGTSVLLQVIERARARQVSLRLRTHRVNRAVNLYRRLGFREYARTDTHILMEWSQASVPAMSEDPRQIIGVAAVALDRDGRILLIKTAKAGWELPGGRVEQGEDLLTALKREVQEETHCEVGIGRLTGVTSNIGPENVTIFTFLCQHTGGDPQPGDDSLEAGWFAPDTAVSLITHSVEQLRLKDALGAGQGLTYRAYRRLSGDDQQPERYEMFRLHQY